MPNVLQHATATAAAARAFTLNPITHSSPLTPPATEFILEPLAEGDAVKDHIAGENVKLASIPTANPTMNLGAPLSKQPATAITSSTSTAEVQPAPAPVAALTVPKIDGDVMLEAPLAPAHAPPPRLSHEFYRVQVLPTIFPAMRSWPHICIHELFG